MTADLSSTSINQIQCGKCNRSLPQSEFHKDRTQKTGHHPYCKQCKIQFEQKRRARKRDEINSKNREKYRNNPNSPRDWMRQYCRGNRAVISERRKGQAQARPDPVKAKARSLVHAALRNGHLVKPACCEKCKSKPASRDLQAHHKDYSKPLEVVWLCTTCHGVTYRKY